MMVEYTKIVDCVVIPMTDAEIAQHKLDTAAYAAELAANGYKTARAAAYPSIADQLDTIYHEGLDAWKSTILAVKAEYPKP
jgi:hypothetical protein